MKYFTLETKDRTPGISAILRVKNGEDFLDAAIETHINYYDEIIAVFNQCTDNSLNILKNKREKYPNKIKIFHYRPEVYPVGSIKHRFTPDTDIHSIVRYNNFALSKTTHRFITKLDDDHIPINNNFERALEIVKNDNKFRTIYCYSGINLLKFNNKLGVYANHPFVGNKDHWFAPYSEITRFVHHPQYEILYFYHLRVKYVGILYYHLKYLKKDHGFSNYQLNLYPESIYKTKLESFLREAEFQEFNNYITYNCKKKNLYPKVKPKFFLEKLPFWLLKNIRFLPVIKRHIALSRTINFERDMKNQELPHIINQITSPINDKDN